MKRIRDYITVFFLTCLVGFFCSTALGNAPTSAAAMEQPNIIFIMADDLGYGDLGSYGQKVIQTPHLDQMAAEGVRFTQCYAGAAVCAPSRSVLMTGRHTGHTTVRGNFSKVGGTMGLMGRGGRVPLRDEDLTVAEVLKDAGYTTGMVGKWGLGEPGTTGHPNEQGFDYWFGFLSQRRAHDYYPLFLWENDRIFPMPGNREGRQQTYAHDVMTEKALHFIEQNHAKPFFLYVPYLIPHSEYQIPEMEHYVQDSWTHDEQVHASMITRMDRDIGRLFKLLGDLGIDEKTIVFFCSDNGAAERWEGRFDSSGVLRGRKRDLYEGGIRSPMIVRWPGKIQPRVDTEAVWTFADLLPTLAALGGGATPKGIDGINVAPVLFGGSETLPERVLYWEFHEKPFQQAIRWKDWKAIRRGVGGPVELYNLSEDIRESNNLAGSFPDLVKKMKRLMVSERSPSPQWPLQKGD